MALILDGKLEIGAHEIVNSRRHFSTSRAAANLKSIFRKDQLYYKRAQRVLSDYLK